MIGRYFIVLNSENFSEHNAKKNLSKNFLPLRYRKIVKNPKKINRLLISRKFYDIRDHVRSKSFHRF